MGKRTQGALRLGLGLPAYIVALLVSWPIMVAAGVVWIVDSSWQIVTGSDGLTDENPVAKAYGWYTGWFRYIAFGDSSGNSSRGNRWLRN